MQYTREQYLMWTDVTVTINANVNPVDDIYNTFALFYSLEKEFTRFSEKSDLSILNKNKEYEVSNRFVKVLELSKELYNDTEKYFNPLINISNIWYSSDFWKWVFEKTDVVQNLELDKITILWNFVCLKDGQKLDFGWVVKWYAVDLATEYLKSKWYTDFIINAWWDIYLSWNNKNGKTPVVAIDSPFNKDEIFATLELKDMSISTSWTYKRKWNIEEKQYNHILNPISNTNNNEIISISIIHDKCYLADAYATTCIAMWIEKSLQFLSEKNIDWVIIWSDGKLYQTIWMSKYNFEIV